MDAALTRLQACWTRRARASLVAFVVALGSACCVSGPTPRALVDARLDTPRGTIEAFQTYLRGDLVDMEYRCLSQGFTRSFQPPISLFTYAAAREQLAREQPWFKLFATAEVLSEEAVDEGRHGVVVAVAGRTWRVNLVREDFFRIHWDGGAEEGGRAALETLSQLVAAADSSAELHITLPLRESDTAGRRLSSATVERLWKIDSVIALDP